jgi:hypothetical protein
MEVVFSLKEFTVGAERAGPLRVNLRCAGKLFQILPDNLGQVLSSCLYTQTNDVKIRCKAPPICLLVARAQFCIR